MRTATEATLSRAHMRILPALLWMQQLSIFLRLHQIRLAGRHYVLHRSRHSSADTNLLEHDILKTNKPILMLNGTSGLWSKGMKVKQATLGITSSKTKVRQRQSTSRTSILGRCLKDYLTNYNQTWHTHITVVNVQCVTTWMQKDKRQDHIRPKTDFEAWWRHPSRPPWSSSFLLLYLSCYSNIAFCQRF